MGFNSQFNLSTLNGVNGFALNGINASDASGISVSGVGDINGDGTDDLIIGAPNADPNGIDVSGQSYVVFGSSNGWSSQLNLSTLNGSNGFALNGINALDASGISVSGVGDINDDGTDDLIIGAPNADPNGIINSGQNYVVFGSSNGWSSQLNLSTLNGSNGFALNGIKTTDYSGISVSGLGDINDDGTDDLIIGAPNADPNGITNSGQSYVVFGSSNGWSSQLNLSTLNGSNGFALNGINANDKSGISVSGLVDINDDGTDDLIIGARDADPNGITNSGQSYVVFGSSNGWSSQLNLSTLNASNGFALNGINASDYSGWSVSAVGDINGDGRDDLIIGARNADPNGRSNSGQSYVVFSAQGPSIIKGDNNDNLLNGDIANDTIIGYDGDDTLNGFEGDDSLEGGGDNDTLDGGIGNDTLNGGTGNDTYIIDTPVVIGTIPYELNDDIIETSTVTTEIDTVEVGYSYSLENNLENLILTGSSDNIIGIGQTLDNSITGNNGSNILFGVSGKDTLIGNEGNDDLLGGEGNDDLLGGEGNDDLLGGEGNDDLLGGEGNDDLLGGEGNDDLLVVIIMMTYRWGFKGYSHRQQWQR